MGERITLTSDDIGVLRVVAGVGIAVGTSRTHDRERKRRLEAAAQQAVLDAIAASERAGTGYPSDAVLREAVRAAMDRVREEFGR